MFPYVDGRSLKVGLQGVGWGAWAGYGKVSGSCKCGNELLDFIKLGEISWWAEDLMAS